jgi:RNA polymerase sigma-70 factor, ECF subfamily
MTAALPDTESLMKRASEGDKLAVEQLLERHRLKLGQMIAVRMDPRMAARVDPSDVVQETLAAAVQRLSEYLRDRPLPFYPWLRHLAWQRLVDLHRQHIQTRRRSVTREQPMEMALPDQSAMQLADRFTASHTSPSHQMMRGELRQRVRSALDRLPAQDRELLVLMYLEQLSTADIAAVLAISEKAVTMRHLRALDRLRRILTQ